MEDRPPPESYGATHDGEASESARRWPRTASVLVALSVVSAVAAVVVAGAHVLWASESSGLEPDPWALGRFNASWTIARAAAIVAAVTATFAFTALLAHLVRRRDRAPRLRKRRLRFLAVAPVPVLAVATVGSGEQQRVFDAQAFLAFVTAGAIVTFTVLAALRSLPRRWPLRIAAGIAIGAVLAAAPLGRSPDDETRKWFHAHESGYRNVIVYSLSVASVSVSPDGQAKRPADCERLESAARALAGAPRPPQALITEVDSLSSALATVGQECPAQGEARQRLASILSGPDARALDEALQGEWRFP